MELIARVMDLFSQIDQQVVAFQLKTGLRCSAGCGDCCRTRAVQATVVEMLPAAHAILRSGQADSVLERIAQKGAAGVCVLYQDHLSSHTGGCCSLYTCRPSVCRLFGFAAVHDRTGARKLAVCRHLKQTAPLAVARACGQSARAPDFSQFGALLLSMDIVGDQLMPINTALHRAIMRLGLHMQMAGAETLVSVSAA